jgi:hypothetical protein
MRKTPHDYGSSSGAGVSSVAGVSIIRCHRRLPQKPMQVFHLYHQNEKTNSCKNEEQHDGHRETYYLCLYLRYF